ncbi:MAG: hypothetical protein RR912_06275 [Clostridium sp.]
MGKEPLEACPHWAVKKVGQVSGETSLKYECFICGETISKLSNTVCYREISSEKYEATTENIAGRFNQANNPDKDAMESLIYILNDNSQSNDIKEITLNHIMRINQFKNRLVVDLCEFEKVAVTEMDTYLLEGIRNSNINLIRKQIREFTRSLLESEEQYNKFTSRMTSLDDKDISSVLCVLHISCIIEELNLVWEDDLIVNKVKDLIEDFIAEEVMGHNFSIAFGNISSTIGMGNQFYDLFNKYFLSTLRQ